MQRGNTNRPSRQMIVARVLLAVSIGLLVAAGLLVQGAQAGERPSPGFGQQVQPLQRATNTMGPTVTPTAFGAGATTTPTTGGTIDPTLPDLVVVAMRISIEFYEPCATTYNTGLQVTIRNNGGSAAGPFTVEANGTMTVDVAGLAAGESTRVWFPSYRYSDPNTATVDSTNQVVESNESNNTRTERLPVPTPPLLCTPTPTPSATSTPGGPTNTPTVDVTADPTLPDLVVTAMQITLESGNACATSTNLGLRVYLRNNGASAAAMFSVTANGATMDVVGGLDAGSSTSLWFPGYRYGEPNTATVDSTNLVAESNEDNNTLTQMVPIPTLPIPCTATPTVDLTASPTTTAIPTVGVPGARWYLPLVGTTREENPTPEP